MEGFAAAFGRRKTLFSPAPRPGRRGRSRAGWRM